VYIPRYIKKRMKLVVRISFHQYVYNVYYLIQNIHVVVFPKKSFFLKSVIISSNFILRTLHTISNLSEAGNPLAKTNSLISLQLTLHVIVMNNSGYPNFLQMAIAS